MIHLSACRKQDKYFPIRMHVSQYLEIFSRIPGMSSHFWIGGLKVATSWVWIDGSPMAMGTPFWGYVRFKTVFNSHSISFSLSLFFSLSLSARVTHISLLLSTRLHFLPLPFSMNIRVSNCFFFRLVFCHHLFIT